MSLAKPGGMSANKILVATDFSDAATQAVTVACRLTEQLGNDLIIAHAWFLPALAYGEEPFELAGDVLQRMVDDDTRALDDEVARRTGECKRPVAKAMLRGAPSDAIVDLAKADPAIGAIVVATHGRTGLRRVLLGSVAERVIRHAPCSVLVVRNELALPVRSVLCPVDFTPSSQVAIDAACRLVAPGGTGITLLHVIEAPTSHGGELPATFLREVDKRAAAALEAVAAEVRAKTAVPVTTKLRVGYAGAQILAELDHRFDLVAMGSHGRTGLARALLGSVAEKVTRHAPCSVWIGRVRA